MFHRYMFKSEGVSLQFSSLSIYIYIKSKIREFLLYIYTHIDTVKLLLFSIRGKYNDRNYPEISRVMDLQSVFVWNDEKGIFVYK